MKLLFAVLALIANAYGHSPVLLWPAEEFALPEGQSVLDMMNLDDFQKLFDGKKIIVFHKRTFNLEEVSYPKTPLSYLQTVDAIALQGVKSIHRFVGGLTSSENLKFVRLSDGDLDGQQDQIMNAVNANPGFAAILVGSGSHRSRRAADDAPVSCSKKGKDEKCMAYIGSIDIEGKQGSCSVDCADAGMTITVNNQIKLDVVFDEDKQGYSLKASAPYSIETESKWAPKEFSYSCGALKLVSTNPDAAKKNPTVILRRLQIYPASGDSFPESYDCATWFTSTLWMGTVVTLFYISILFVAVLYLLDVKTNDRFDDPKGKTITVNVSE